MTPTDILVPALVVLVAADSVTLLGTDDDCDLTVVKPSFSILSRVYTTVIS